MTTIEQMVQREVLCCMSSLVATLAQSYGHDAKAGNTLSELQEQASELAAPVLDYEEAAIQEGKYLLCGDGHKYWCLTGTPARADAKCATAEGFCMAHDIDPYEWEVYEHWAVSQWLAEKLVAHGERVDTDFAGLNIWARTTTGQAISMDGCIERIYAEMTKPCVAEGEARVAPRTLDSVAPGS